MAKEIQFVKTTSASNESNGGSNNNLYQKGFEKSVSNDSYSNGMGIARPSELKGFETVPGSQPNDQYLLKNREVARYSELERKAFGNPTINNAGIVLDSFGGTFGEGGSKPDIQGGANK